MCPNSKRDYGVHIDIPEIVLAWIVISGLANHSRVRLSGGVDWMREEHVLHLFLDLFTFVFVSFV